MDMERMDHVSKNVSKNLEERGVLLIGKKHLGQFTFEDDIEVKVV